MSFAESSADKISYTYGNGRLLAKVEGTNPATEEVYYYHQDDLGSTMLMTDAEGEVLFEQDYAPFGQNLYRPGLTKDINLLMEEARRREIILRIKEY